MSGTPSHSLRVVLVDDEELARRLLREYLCDDARFEIVAECSDGRSAVETIESKNPDLVFLDIQMPELNGIDVVEQLESPPAIIFSTAHDEYAIRAFEINAVDYLLKPYDRERFEHCLDRALARMGNGPRESETIEGLLRSLRTGRPAQRLWVKHRGKLVPVRCRQIDWIEAMDNYCCLHVGPQSHLISCTMKELEARLDPETFLRSHRSNFVNVDRIAEIRAHGDGYRVVLEGGLELPMSRTQARRLKRDIG